MDVVFYDPYETATARGLKSIRREAKASRHPTGHPMASSAASEDNCGDTDGEPQRQEAYPITDTIRMEGSKTHKPLSGDIRRQDNENEYTYSNHSAGTAGAKRAR